MASNSTTELRLNRWQRLGRDFRALPLPQAGKLLLRKASKGWRARQSANLAGRQIAAIHDNLSSVLNGDANQNLAGYLENHFTQLEGFPLLPSQKQAAASLIHQYYPAWVARCRDQANRICDNRISILGKEICVEEPPAWHKDHLSGTIWPAGPSNGLRGLRMAQGSDIKFVWELSRFHHGVTLGRAFALTREERFAEKFVSLFSDWQMANPPGIGPNWTCAMEAAIRAVNFLWAGSLLAASTSFDPAFKEAFARTVLAHGVFIYHHLEFNEQTVGRSLRRVNGNHYLSDLVGLLHISVAFPDYRHAAEWRDFATRELFHEIRMQVDDDGVHWEYSPGYQRLVLEMILACLMLLERRGIAVPPDIRDKSIKMLDFIRHYRKPSGGVPLVRDIDSGRFCILGEPELTNHDHLLALGAIYFDQLDFYPGELFEDCLWQMGTGAHDWHLRQSTHSPSPATEERPMEELSSNRELSSPGSKLYPQSGFALMRHEDHHLIAVCCPKGMNGYCGHTHNDFLSFELEAYGRTFLTDCGSYVYTQSPEWRNRFRSALSHNALMVDGQEQNRFNSSQLFEIDSSVQPEIRCWSSSLEQDVLEGAYSINMPDGSKMTHERRFVFLKERALWLLRDRVTGVGTRKIETRFHFGEGIDIEIGSLPPLSTLNPRQTVCRTLCAPGPNIFLIAVGEAPLSSFIETGWLSKTYAAKSEIRVLRFEVTVQLPYEQWYALVPARGDASSVHCPVENLDEILRSAGVLSNGKTRPVATDRGVLGH